MPIIKSTLVAITSIALAAMAAPALASPATNAVPPAIIAPAIAPGTSPAIAPAIAPATAPAIAPGVTDAMAATAATITANYPEAPDANTDMTAAAEAAGIEEDGDAYMGWSIPFSDGDGSPSDSPTAQPQASAPSSYATQQSATSAPTAYGLQPLPQIRQVGGVDVSHWQWDNRTQPFDWNYWSANNWQFAYVKATEGTYYRDNRFAENYNGSYDAGMIRGAYHFARPNLTGGAAQAEYFVRNGGGWSADGRTLPGVLDIEHNPKGAMCYGKTSSQMRAWIADFTSRYLELTGRQAVIYTSPGWWETCTGNTNQFAKTNPLWLAHYTTGTPRIPGNWASYTIWQHGVYNYKILQHTDSKGKKRIEKFPIDLNEFAGTNKTLKTFAARADAPTAPPAPICDTKLFSDILDVKQFCSPITWLFRSEVTTGYDDGSFRPRASITRQAMAAFLYRLANPGAAKPTCDHSPFNDVTAGSPFCGEITWLKAQHLTTGYDDGGFHPTAPITRQALAAQLFRLATSDAPAPNCPVNASFSDLVDNRFCGEIDWLAKNEIAKGYRDGSFGPGKAVTRGAMSAFLYRLTRLTADLNGSDS